MIACKSCNGLAAASENRIEGRTKPEKTRTNESEKGLRSVTGTTMWYGVYASRTALSVTPSTYVLLTAKRPQLSSPRMLGAIKYYAVIIQARGTSTFRSIVVNKTIVLIALVDPGEMLRLPMASPPLASETYKVRNKLC